VDSLPLTPVGKVDKKRLRQQLDAQLQTQAQGD
jgi:2,3-dihydroxybenzoate-AMP ligase